MTRSEKNTSDPEPTPATVEEAEAEAARAEAERRRREKEVSESRAQFLQVLRDPYTITTRKARRNLLSVSTIGLTVVYAGVVPTRVPALGIALTEQHQSALLIVLGFAVVYFLVGFGLYALAEDAAVATPLHPDQAKDWNWITWMFEKPHTWGVVWVYILRGLFEFFVPIGLGLWAIFALFGAAFPIA